MSQEVSDVENSAVPAGPAQSSDELTAGTTEYLHWNTDIKRERHLAAEHRAISTNNGD